jgi:NADH-quinone oxidoreductase subunit G
MQISPRFGRLGMVEAAGWGAFGATGPVDAAPFRSPIENFYMTDPISRASETMAECTATFVQGQQGKTGTHG